MKSTITDYSPLDGARAPSRPRTWAEVLQELAEIRAMLDVQEAKLAKAGSDLATALEANAVLGRVAAERASVIQEQERRIEELEQLADARLATVVKRQTRILELELARAAGIGADEVSHG